MEAKTAFGERLKAWRAHTKKADGKKMTQDDLATATGLHRVAIANIERGNRGRSPSLDTVVKLAAALGITVDQLTTSMPDAAPAVKPPKPAAKGKRKKGGA